jgi:hypothetical protein
MKYLKKHWQEWKDALVKYRENGSIPFIFNDEGMLNGINFYTYEEIGTLLHERKNEKIQFWLIVLLWVMLIYSAYTGMSTQIIVFFSLVGLFGTITFYFMQKVQYLYVIDNNKKRQKKKKIWLGFDEDKADIIINRIRKEMFTRGYPSPEIEKKLSF